MTRASHFHCKITHILGLPSAANVFCLQAIKLFESIYFSHECTCYKIVDFWGLNAIVRGHVNQYIK